MRKSTFIICLFCLLVLLFSSLKIAAQETDYILFDRDGKIILSSMDGKQQTELIRGDHPNPSPDGQKIAFTLPKNDKGIIAVYDLKTKQLSTFKNIPGNNNYRPIWSPDGSKLAFYHQPKDKKRQLAIINANDSEFKILSKIKPYYIFWDTDGQHIWSSYQGVINKIDLKGTVSSKIAPLSFFTKNKDWIDWYFWEGEFLFKAKEGIVLCPFHNYPGDNGTIDNHTLYFFSFKSKKLQQLTPRSVNVAYPSFSFNKKQIVFSGIENKEAQINSSKDCCGPKVPSNIYVSSLTDLGINKIIDNGEQPKWIRIKGGYDFNK